MSVNIKVTLNIECGQIDPKVTGGLKNRRSHGGISLSLTESSQYSCEHYLSESIVSIAIAPTTPRGD